MIINNNTAGAAHHHRPSVIFTENRLNAMKNVFTENHSAIRRNGIELVSYQMALIIQSNTYAVSYPFVMVI
jgi:hypothetical protein